MKYSLIPCALCFKVQIDEKEKNWRIRAQKRLNCKKCKVQGLICNISKVGVNIRMRIQECYDLIGREKRTNKMERNEEGPKCMGRKLRSAPLPLTKHEPRRTPKENFCFLFLILHPS